MGPASPASDRGSFFTLAAARYPPRIGAAQPPSIRSWETKASVMVELLLRGTFRPGRPDHRAPERRGRLGSRIIRGVLWATAIALAALLGWGVMLEMRTSFAHSLLFSLLSYDMTFP